MAVTLRALRYVPPSRQFSIKPAAPVSRESPTPLLQQASQALSGILTKTQSVNRSQKIAPAGEHDGARASHSASVCWHVRVLA